MSIKDDILLLRRIFFLFYRLHYFINLLGIFFSELNKTLYLTKKFFWEIPESRS